MPHRHPRRPVPRPHPPNHQPRAGRRDPAVAEVREEVAGPVEEINPIDLQSTWLCLYSECNPLVSEAARWKS